MFKKRIVCLGIESSAHTLGVSISSSDKGILSDVKAVYKPPLGKGIHPREAAQHHCDAIARVIERAFHESGIKWSEIDIVAYCKGPGLGPCLRVGATAARALACYLKVPLVPVHHAVGHIEIATLTTGSKDPLVVLVSGGHTCIAAFADRRWRIFGETEDITLGNLLDMFAREAGLPAPGGSALEECARAGRNYIPLPYTQKGNDVSYSGLLTAVIKKLKEGKYSVEDLSYSLQEVAFAALAEATERALAHTEKSEVLLAGGVAANKRLQEMIKHISDEHNARFCVVPERFSGDCGAQIAWTGILAFKCGVKTSLKRSFVQSRWRLDKVPIPWRNGE
ncbi:MAG: KEOPS complex N(6)-L-threonylcarbamoyladenine synthase Kae1 [Candidatus Bathyarchaeia archaeon]